MELPNKYLKTNNSTRQKRIDVDEQLKLLANKIIIEEHTISNTFDIFRQKINETITNLQKIMKEKLRSYHFAYKQLILSSNSNQLKYTSTQKKQESLSPFDYNNSLQIQQLSALESEQLDKDLFLIRQEYKGQQSKLYDDIKTYIFSKTHNKLYHDEQMLKIIERVNQKVEMFMSEIKETHLKHLIKTTNKSFNFQKNLQEAQNINSITSNLGKNNNYNHTHNQNHSKDNQFRALYQKLQHLPIHKKAYQQQKVNQDVLLNSIQHQFEHEDSQQNSLSDLMRSRYEQSNKNEMSIASIISNNMSVKKSNEIMNLRCPTFNIAHNNSQSQGVSEFIKKPYFKSDGKYGNSPKESRNYSQHKITMNQKKEANKNVEGVKVDVCQQAITLQWCGDVSLLHSNKLSLEDNQQSCSKINKGNMPKDALLCLLIISKAVITPLTQDNDKNLQKQEQYMVMGCKDKNIYVYQLNQQSPTQDQMNFYKLQGHYGSVCTLAIFQSNHADPSSKYLLSGGDTGCNSIIMWEINQWTIYSRFNLHLAAITLILPLLNPQVAQETELSDQDCKYLISGSYDRTIKIYNITENQIETSIQFDSPITNGCFLNNDYSKVCLAVVGIGIVIQEIKVIYEIKQNMENKFVKKFQVTTRNKISLNPHVISALTPFPGTQKLFVGLNNGEICLLDIKWNQSQIDVERLLVSKGSQNKQNMIFAIIVINRLNKIKKPFLLIGCYNQPFLKLIDWDSKYQKNLVSEHQMNLKFGHGIHPLIVINRNKELAIIGQKKNEKQVILIALKCL